MSLVPRVQGRRDINVSTSRPRQSATPSLNARSALRKRIRSGMTCRDPVEQVSCLTWAHVFDPEIPNPINGPFINSSVQKDRNCNHLCGRAGSCRERASDAYSKCADWGIRAIGDISLTAISIGCCVPMSPMQSTANATKRKSSTRDLSVGILPPDRSLFVSTETQVHPQLSALAADAARTGHISLPAEC